MLVVVEKSSSSSSSHRRWHSESRVLTKSTDFSERNVKKDGFIREKRNPLLDRVKDTKLSCFQSSEILSQFPDDVQQHQSSRMDVKLIEKKNNNNDDNDDIDCFSGGLSGGLNKKTNKKQDENMTKNWKTYKVRRRNGDVNESFNGNSCLGAKLRSISDRFLKSSTNRILAKLYKQNDFETPKKGRGGNKKLRSFSYGALPGLEEFHNKGNPLYIDDDSEYNHNDKILLMDGTSMPDCEDGDSGIIVNDSTSCVLEIDKKLISHSRSASGEQQQQQQQTIRNNSSICDKTNRDSWSSDRSSVRSLKNARRRKRLSKRSVSLDRREVLKNYQKQSRGSSEGDEEEFQDDEEEDDDDDDGEDRIKQSATSSSSSSSSPSECKRIFKVIRLFRSSPDEELGIFIAKTKLADQGAPGYLIAHIVPDGLADR